MGGIDGSITHSHGGDGDAQLGAVGIASTHIGFGYEDPTTVRVVSTGSLAGGPNGIQGGLSSAVAGGVRLSLGKSHGAVVRGGAEGFFFGNRYLWDSFLEFPQLQVGYQWLVPGSVVDVAMKGGYVLFGRHNTGDSVTRDLDASLEWGAIGAVHLGPLDLRANYTRVLVDQGATPIDLVEGAVCGLARILALCTNVRYELGEGRLSDGTLRSTRVSFVGLTAGLFILDRYKRVRKR